MNKDAQDFRARAVKALEEKKAVAIAQGILQAVHQLNPKVFPKPNSDLSSAT